MSSLTQIPPTPAQKVAAFREGRGRSEPYALAIVTRVVGAAACRVGDRYLVTREGDLIGVVGGGCMRSALRTAGLAAIAEGEPRHVRVIPKEHDGTPPDPAVDHYLSSCPSGGAIDLFIEPVLPGPTLQIFGDTEIADSVAALAPIAGFAVARTGTADAKADVDPAYILVATQGQGDGAALEAAIAGNCRQVLFLASRKKAEYWRAELARKGVGESRLATLISPAGLNIGAQGPGEIAMSIMAQLIALRRTGGTEHE